MLSAGIRVGSLEHLKWKYIIPILRNNVIIASKIVLKNTKISRDYFSFITPEAYNALKDWMDFRKLHGEQITGESWLVRNTCVKLDMTLSHRVGVANLPKFFSATAIRNIINDAWRVQGVRDLLDADKNEKRHEFKSTHCFRKYSETKCQLKMIHNNIKILMDHSMGESQNYHRPTEEDLLLDYLNVVDVLTINDEFRLRKKIEVLEIEKSRIDKLEAKMQRLERRRG